MLRLKRNYKSFDHKNNREIRIVGDSGRSKGGRGGAAAPPIAGRRADFFFF